MGKTLKLTDEQLAELLKVNESEAEDNQDTLKTTKLTKKKVSAEFDEGESENEVEVYESEEEESDEDKEEVSEESEEVEEEVEEEVSEVSEESEEDEEEMEEEVSEVSEESEEEDEDEDEDEEMEEEKKELAIEEDMNALFNGEDLSEEFMEKASTIFGAALQSHLKEEVSKLEEQYASKLEESVAAVTESLTDKIDTYLDYVVEEWVKENELAIEQGLRLEIMENFMGDLKTLFNNNNIEVPAEKVDLVAEAKSELVQKENELNESIEKNVELKRELSELKKQVIISTVSEGLTVSQSEKLVNLAEGVEFSDAEAYEKKIRLIRENYFPEETVIESEVKETSGEVLVEEEKKPATKIDPMMESYVSAISRTIKK